MKGQRGEVKEVYREDKGEERGSRSRGRRESESEEERERARKG